MSQVKSGSFEPSQEIFEWVKLKQDLGLPDDVLVESAPQKFVRKFKENPFVPIGAGVTLGCLVYGLISFKRGNTQMSQYMMRGRVAAQGFTVLALVGGIYAAATKAS